MKKILKTAAFMIMLVAISAFVITASPIKSDNSAYAITLTQGSRGTTVKKVQKKLKNWGYYKGSIDGVYGAKTKQAVKKFQQKNKLKADGIVGNKTLAAMGLATSNSKSEGANSYSDSDVALLARLIYGEARGESYVGQVAVGAVVMNRIKSASFPNTMSGVIYQSYAFSAVNDGQINRRLMRRQKRRRKTL